MRIGGEILSLICFGVFLSWWVRWNDVFVWNGAKVFLVFLLFSFLEGTRGYLHLSPRLEGAFLASLFGFENWFRSLEAFNRRCGLDWVFLFAFTSASNPFGLLCSSLICNSKIFLKARLKTSLDSSFRHLKTLIFVCSHQSGCMKETLIASGMFGCSSDPYSASFSAIFWGRSCRVFALELYWICFKCPSVVLPLSTFFGDAILVLKCDLSIFSNFNSFN